MGITKKQLVADYGEDLGTRCWVAVKEERRKAKLRRDEEKANPDMHHHESDAAAYRCGCYE